MFTNVVIFRSYCQNEKTYSQFKFNTASLATYSHIWQHCAKRTCALCSQIKLVYSLFLFFTNWLPVSHMFGFNSCCTTF